MSFPLQLQTVSLRHQSVSLYVPDAGAVQRLYRQQKERDPQTPFPYWAQVWPAALGLGHFLLQHAHFLKGKNVLELAAGVGLPSLVAAPLAQQVTCTDYVPEAVDAAKRSAQHNQLYNMACRVLDWNHIPEDLTPDVLLMSDVNYEPQQFEMLYRVLERFLQKGTTIILSTPQRLMAKPFVERLLHWCTQQEQLEVPHQQQTVPVTVLVLKAV